MNDILLTVIMFLLLLVFWRIGEVIKILQLQLDGVKEWKEWDKKHHLEELETKKILHKLSKSFDKFWHNIFKE